MTIKEVCAKHNLSQVTFYGWRRKFSGMEVNEARRLKSLESECARLKKIVAELTVQNDSLKEVNSTKW